MKKLRTLTDGRAVTVHRNDGIRKRCDCLRRAWATCGHPWHFSFKWRETHHRFPIDKYAERPLVTKDDARDEADRLRRLIRAGTFPPVSITPATPTTPSELTFETFGAKWVTNARSTHSKNQQMNDRGIVQRLSKVNLGDGAIVGQRPIGVLTVDDWETVFRQFDGAASTRNKVRQAILMMQEWAVDKGYLPRPWLSGKVLKKGGSIARQKGARRDRRLIPDVLDDGGRLQKPGEERRLLSVASAWLQNLIIAALESCCRRGELLSLQWHDVSLSRGQLTIRAENTKANTMRQIPISPRLRAVLTMLEHDPAGHPQAPAAFVFGDTIGRKICDPKKRWVRACRAAGVENLHFHDLRHEAGSRLSEAGWPLHHVQHMLGHQDAKTTSIYLNATIQELTDSMKRYGSGGQLLHNVAQPTESEHPLSVQVSDERAVKTLVN
jgi:integrase